MNEYIKNKQFFIRERAMTLRTLFIYSLGLYFALLPLNAINIGVLGSALKIFAILPILFGAFLLGTKKINKLVKYYFIYSVFSLISIVWSIDDTMTISRCISYFQLFALMLVAGCVNYQNNEILFLKKCLTFSSIASGLLILVFGKFIEGRLWLTGILKEDPNYFCLYLVFGIIYNLQEIMSKKKTRFKLINGLLLLWLIAIIVFTGSRGGLIATIIAVLSYVFFYNKKVASAKKILILILIILFVYFVLTSISSNMLRGRFTIDSIISSGGTGRFEIWAQGLDLFKSSPLINQMLGYGSATIQTAFFTKGYPITSVMHNMFLETLVELGVVGFAIYVAMVFAFLKVSFKNVDKFSFAVLIGMVALSMSTSIYTFKPYINIMIMIICEGNMIIKKRESFFLKPVGVTENEKQ